MLLRSTRGVLIAVCAVLFAVGVILSSLGPILPDLQIRTGASLATLGTIFTAWFVGSLAAQVGTGVFGERLGWRRLLLGEIALMVIGLVGVLFSPTLPIALVWSVLAGMGQGGADVSFSVLTAEVFATRRVAALNFVNVFFGLGAITGPLFVSLALRAWGSGLPVLGAGIAIMVAVVPWVAGSPALERPIAATVAAERAPGAIASPLLWVLGIFFLGYVGAETAIGGWTTEYLRQTTTLNLENAALATSAFWLALTLARGGMIALERRARPLVLMLGSLGVALIGALLLIVGRGQIGFSIGAIIVLGLSFGPLYPTALAWTTFRFSGNANRAAGLVVALGSVGGALIPWFQGILLARLGPASTTIFIALLIGVMACLIIGVQWSESAHRHARSSPQIAPLPHLDSTS